jgi:hypothetical protein
MDLNVFKDVIDRFFPNWVSSPISQVPLSKSGGDVNGTRGQCISAITLL